MKIRPYVENYDFSEISRWAYLDPGVNLVKEQFSPTTFIADISDTNSAAVVSILLTNCKYYCILEGFFTNPSLTARVRKDAMAGLLSYVEAFAKALEYKGLFCIPIHERMARHLTNMGFNSVSEKGITSYKFI